MATDIYRRVSELAADKRKNMSPKQFFESDEYTLYLKKKAENIISGSFHELRRQGFNVREKEEKKLIRSLNVVSVWDPNSTDTAYCEHSPYGYTIFINTGNDLILRAQDLDAMHWCVTGLLYHEIGHLLYTDYPSLRAWTNQKNDEYNEKALNAFSYFAKTAMNDYTMEDIDPEQLINHYIRAEVVHTKVPSNKDPNKEVTFANLGDKSPADGFDTEPVARALTLGNGNNAAPKAAPKTQTASAPAKTGLDIDALLG